MPKTVSFEDLSPEYSRLWGSMEICTSKATDIEQTAAKIVSKKSRYQAVAKETGVPWFVVGMIHAMEAGCNFACHLHNGDSLARRTVQVPAGRPKAGEPPFTWKDSAVDAIRYDGLDKVTEWPIERVCFELEKFNGWGYRNHHPDVLSPYLWSGSNHYARGKYVQDGKWSASAVSGQSGALPILKRMMALDATIRPGEPVGVPETIEEVVADASLAFPRANPDTPNVVNVAAQSKTVWTLLSAGALKLVDSFTDWLHQGWDLLLWVMGLVPDAVKDAKDQVDSTEQITSWLQFDKGTATGLITIVVIVALIVAIVRHTNLKKDSGHAS